MVLLCPTDSRPDTNVLERVKRQSIGETFGGKGRPVVEYDGVVLEAGRSNKKTGPGAYEIPYQLQWT